MNIINDVLGWVCNKLGYFSTEQHEELKECHDHVLMENRGLVNAIGYLQRESEEQNTLLCALILLGDQEQVTLTKEYFSDIVDKGVEAKFGQDDDGNINIVVETREEE